MRANKSMYDFLRPRGVTYLTSSIIRAFKLPQMYSETKFTGLIAVPNSLLLEERY